MTDFTLHFTRQSLEQLHSVLVSASHFLPKAFENDIKIAQTFKHDVADTFDVPEHTAESVNFLKEVNLEDVPDVPDVTLFMTSEQFQDFRYYFNTAIRFYHAHSAKCTPQEIAESSFFIDKLLELPLSPKGQLSFLPPAPVSLDGEGGIFNA